MITWTCALGLDAARQTVAGSHARLATAVRDGADLRIRTEFRHNEHIDITSPNAELVREVAEFGVTYLVDDRWTAGVMNLRQPIDLPDGFGPRPSMSFFLYNQDGQQAIARPFLDSERAGGVPGPASPVDHGDMDKYHLQEGWDAETDAPSENFVYDFDSYRFCVDERWSEVLSHDAVGRVAVGSVESLTSAFEAGCAVKVSISGLCEDLGDVAHQVFVQVGSCYHYTERGLFVAGSHPVVRVRPDIPMAYRSGRWDFGWLLLRTDGHTVYRRCDPYTLAFSDIVGKYALRWFVA